MSSKIRFVMWLIIGLMIGAILGLKSEKLILGISIGALLGVLLYYLTTFGMRKE